MISMIQLLPNSLLALLPMNALLAQTSDFETPATHAPGPIFWIIYCVVVILMIAAIGMMQAQPGCPALLNIFQIAAIIRITTTQ